MERSIFGTDDPEAIWAQVLETCPEAGAGVHPWLFGLALWSRMTGVDPVAVYERGAPVLVVLASISSARALAVELFGDGRRARLCVVAAVLLWSGSSIPLLARAGEDKVLAASALLPLCVAAFLRITRRGDRAAWLLLVLAALATAAVHALAYAFVLVALLPTAAMLANRMEAYAAETVARLKKPSKSPTDAPERVIVH